MRSRLPAGAATGIGSVPHTDPVAAVDFVLRHQPLLPAAPQLPQRSAGEAMIAQVAKGIVGVTVEPDGSLALDRTRLDAKAPVDTTFDDESWSGLLAFLDAVEGRTGAVKLQLTGPITLGLALVHAGASPTRSFDVASRAVRAWARALVDLARTRVPDAPLVVFLDEPGLTAAGHPGFPLDAEPAIDLLSGALAAIESVISGVHCCGSTDWSIPVKAGAQILSLPLDASVVDDAPLLASFLDEDGWIAWGAVPTNGPVGTDADVLWRRLTGVWCDLTRAGCDPLQLRKHSLVTPACGLALHGESQADLVMDLCTALAERVHDQALATRLSVGA